MVIWVRRREQIMHDEEGIAHGGNTVIQASERVNEKEIKNMEVWKLDEKRKQRQYDWKKKERHEQNDGIHMSGLRLWW